jgi:hypothetical protein
VEKADHSMKMHNSSISPNQNILARNIGFGTDGMRNKNKEFV